MIELRCALSDKNVASHQPQPTVITSCPWPKDLIGLEVQTDDYSQWICHQWPPWTGAFTSLLVPLFPFPAANNQIKLVLIDCDTTGASTDTAATGDRIRLPSPPVPSECLSVGLSRSRCENRFAVKKGRYHSTTRAEISLPEIFHPVNSG